MAKTITVNIVWSIVIPIAVFVGLAAFQLPSPFTSMTVGTSAVCHDHGYEVQMLSTEPLLIRIKNFLSPMESTYLTEISTQNYTHRLYVEEEDVKKKIAPPLAVLNAQDPIVQCVQHRASKFLGSMAPLDFELLSLNRYGVSHQVQPHLDTSKNPMIDKKTGRRFNRRTSFFVYVHASDDLEGGETYFPYIPAPMTVFDPAVRSRNNSLGSPALAVKPVSGSAIFWLGLKSDGTRYHETLHEGLPVTKGEKIGMNIWAKHYLE